MRFAVHDNDVFIIINSKSGYGIACVVGNCNMAVVRENHKILGIIAADREGEFLFKKPWFPDQSRTWKLYSRLQLCRKDVFRQAPEQDRKPRCDKRPCRVPLTGWKYSEEVQIQECFRCRRSCKL